MGKRTAPQSKSNRSPKQIDRAFRDVEYLDLYSYCPFLVMQIEVFLCYLFEVCFMSTKIQRFVLPPRIYYTFRKRLLSFLG